MMKNNVAALTLWLSKTTMKQRLVLGIGGFLMIGMIGLGIYTVLPKSSSASPTSSTTTEVTVQDINDKNSAQPTATPAETLVVETPPATAAQTNPNVESNTVTVDTPVATEEYYFEDDGSRYEAVQETPVYTQTPVVQETPVVDNSGTSSGGWDGNLGGSDPNYTGGENYGTGVSN